MIWPSAAVSPPIGTLFARHAVRRGFFPFKFTRPAATRESTRLAGTRRKESANESLVPLFPGRPSPKQAVIASPPRQAPLSLETLERKLLLSAAPLTEGLDEGPYAALAEHGPAVAGNAVDDSADDSNDDDLVDDSPDDSNGDNVDDSSDDSNGDNVDDSSDDSNDDSVDNSPDDTNGDLQVGVLGSARLKASLRGVRGVRGQVKSETTSEHDRTKTSALQTDQAAASATYPRYVDAVFARGFMRREWKW